MGKIGIVVIGLLTILGGIFTFHESNKYFALIKTKGTENLFSSLGLWSGYVFGILIVFLGIGFISAAFIVN
ncbi:hypothetical protein FOD82_07690 [Lactobacillus sp. LL6]|nr:hypothetical protein FOD82_07690 [Lactobacillus sp. LL6]